MSEPVKGEWGGGRGPEGSERLGLALILTAAFMVVLDFSIVNVALASIERELGFSPSGRAL